MQTVTIPMPAEVHVAVTQQPPSGIRQNYNACTSKCLGSTQIALGVFGVMLQMTAIALEAGLYHVGHGIWCGTVFIVAGAFGITAGHSKRTGYIITFMVLSILAASIFAPTLLGCASGGLSRDLYCSSYHNYSRCRSNRIVNGLMILIAGAEGIIAIISSAICCRSLCCSKTTTPQMAHPACPQDQLQYNPATGQQMLIVTTSAGQNQYLPVVYPTQPGQTQPTGDIDPPPYHLATLYPQGAVNNNDQARLQTACGTQHHYQMVNKNM